jgi:HAD superfamily hydrolase (TIGR01509 family)
VVRLASRPLTEAVIFDLDGLLIDSESVWDRARRDYVDEHGGRWLEEATREMMGMSSVEWSRYVRERLGVDRSTAVISSEVARRVGELYERELPLMPGAVDAVRRIAACWPLGLASSSNREVIDQVLARAGIEACFGATVSSEEVGAGKPAPDVYLEAARRLQAPPSACVAIEDSHNGILSARAARMAVIAVPNPHFSPGEEALAAAARILPTIQELSVELVEEVGG